MVKYFYEKYSVKEEYKTPVKAASKQNKLISLRKKLAYGAETFEYYPDYTFSGKSGFLSKGQVVNGVLNASPPVGYYVVSSRGEYVLKILSTSYTEHDGIEYMETERYDTELAKVKNTLVDTIQAEDGTYPLNGIHTDGFWYVKGVVTNRAPSTPGAFSLPYGETVEGGKVESIAWGPSTDPDGDNITYHLSAAYDGGAYTIGNITPGSAYGSSLSQPVEIKKGARTVRFRVQAVDPNGGTSGFRESITYTVKNNNAPTLTLNMANGITLYESDSYVITGTAQDVNAGDVVMVKYKINNGTARTIASPVSTGAEFPFNKFLTFKEGKLFDGATAITSALSEGTQHVLTLWVEDDKGGKSAETTRTFYAVPNRPPKLTVDPITPKTDMIDTDSFEIKGTVNNPDANGVKVHYKIGNTAYQEVYSSAGAGGAFSFRLSLSQLSNGVNSLTVRATDAFGAVDTKTITITKAGTSLPLKTAVTRYKLTPPNGTAKGVLLWIERETGDLTVDAEISMTNAGEPESYKPMNRKATAFVREDIEEDEFTFDAITDKTEIILKLTMTRTSTASNKGITLISGVFN